MTARALAAVCSALLLLSPPAAAGVTTTADWSTGNGYRGWDGRGRLDFGSRGDWALTAEYAWAHSKAGTESFSKQGTLGFEHNPDDNWSFRGTGTWWKDDLSGLVYAGPSWGFTYLLTKDRPSQLSMKTLQKLRERETGEPINNQNSEPPEELWGFSFDNDLFFYRAPEVSAPRFVKLKGVKAPVLVPSAPDAVHVTSWHPTVTVEKPLLKEHVIPSLMIGHDFFSKNPVIIESRAGQPRFSAAAGSLNALAGGFFTNNGQAAVDFRLPYHARLHGSLAAQQSATDQTWAVTQELSLKSTVDDTCSLTGKWDRTLQGGQATDQYTAGLIVYF